MTASDTAAPGSHAAGSAPLLFTPIRLRSLTARNRVVVSPMCQYASEGGGPTDYHLVHLGQFALGGAGIVFSEETSVEERGRKTWHCAGIYDDRHVPAYRRLTEFLGAHGAIPAMQIGHSGRKGAISPPWQRYQPLTEADARAGHAPWPIVSSSALPDSPQAQTPHSLSTSEIAQLLGHWREAAQRALAAGYRILEVHSAHGYLLHQFLSPIANQRRDGYGGDLAGRMRLTLEVIETVRAVWPAELPLFLRVSAVDGSNGLWTMDDTVTLARAAHERGVDVVTTSSGGIHGPGTAAPVPRVPGYHVPYAERVRHDVPGLQTLSVGLITEPAHAEDILQRGQADLIGLARELLWNPHWPAHAALALGAPDHLDLLPRGYGWWLARREDIRRVTEQSARAAAPL
jgi:2,4-dienoyl-CoA reductase-like NADH-dependent reductase (Old Yellow Enzyme family)